MFESLTAFIKATYIVTLRIRFISFYLGSLPLSRLLKLKEMNLILNVTIL